MYWDVFISHSDKDKKVANTIAEAINSEFYVWYDYYSLNLGDNIDKAIEVGLKLSDFGLVILSKNFFKNFDSSAKEIELSHFIENFVKEKKLLLPIWYKIDKSYLDKQIEKFNLDPRLSKIKAVKIKNKSQLQDQILKIITAIRKRPKHQFSTRQKIKFEEINSILLSQNDLLDGWELENDDFSGDLWEKRVDFINPEMNITLTNAIYHRSTIREMETIFIERKNEAASRMRDGRLANPKLGEESYGYRYPGGSLVVFRVSNLLIRVQYEIPNSTPRIFEPKKFARIVDRNIRSLLTTKFLM